MTARAGVCGGCRTVGVPCLKQSCEIHDQSVFSLDWNPGNHDWKSMNHWGHRGNQANGNTSKSSRSHDGSEFDAMTD